MNSSVSKGLGLETDTKADILTRRGQQYVCDYCGRAFLTKHNTLNHIRNCHISTSCFCDICEEKFSSPAGLRQHLSRGHNRFKQGKPECALCGKIFTRKETIIIHLQTKHLIGGQKLEKTCEVCNKKFTNAKNLKAHIKNLHNVNFEYPTCDECNKVFRMKESLIEHIQAAHNVSAKDIQRCSLCEKVYSCKKNLKQHVVAFHGVVDEYKCSFCSKSFGFDDTLRRHVKTEHNIDLPKEFACEYCSRTFSEQTFLDSHIFLHHKQYSLNPQEITCECGKVFDAEPALRNHIKTDHEFEVYYSYCKNSLLRIGPIGAEKVKQSSSGHDCEICQSHFESLYDLRNHLKANHDLQLSVETCNVCFTKFYSKEAMHQHQKVCVAPNNVIKCSQCEKIFTQKSSFQLHMTVFHPKPHKSSDRSYESRPNSTKNIDKTPNENKCEYCDEIFKTKWKLQKHIEYVHQGMQRFKCLMCESHFKEKRNLRKHIRIKHPKSSMFPQCSFCRKRFESAKACSMHLKQVHSFDSNTFPCEMCSASYNTNDSLTLHMKTKHNNDQELFKCESCSMLFNGYEMFELHNQKCQENKSSAPECVPRCVICMKDFSAEKWLKRHIKRFHEMFDPDELTAIGFTKRSFLVDCKECLKKFTDNDLHKLYLKNKHDSDTIIFKCPICGDTYNVIEFAVQRYKVTKKSRKRKHPPGDRYKKRSDRDSKLK